MKKRVARNSYPKEANPQPGAVCVFVCDSRLSQCARHFPVLRWKWQPGLLRGCQKSVEQ